jgi:membrane-associated phospholipid phosphatase
MASSGSTRSRWAVGNEGFRFAVDCSVMLFVGSVTLVLQQMPHWSSPWEMEFVERNAYLSLGYKDSTISNVVLGLLSLVTPFLLVVLVGRVVGVPGAPPTHRFTWSLVLRNACHVSTTVAAVNIITNVFKMTVGEHRPNFFAACDYKGYAAALASGNFSEYNAATIPGAPGDLAHCAADPLTIREAQLSFPSGHASLSFAGLGFLFFWFLALRADLTSTPASPSTSTVSSSSTSPSSFQHRNPSVVVSTTTAARMTPTFDSINRKPSIIPFFYHPRRDGQHVAGAVASALSLSLLWAILLLPLVVASYVAVSRCVPPPCLFSPPPSPSAATLFCFLFVRFLCRVHDHKHHPVDIFAGGVLGMAGAALGCHWSLVVNKQPPRRSK